MRGPAAQQQQASERRKPGLAPLRELLFGKGAESCRAAASRERSSGSRVCTTASPARSPLPERPATCVNSWKLRSGRPEVRQVQPGIGGDDADEGHLGKVQPLGDHLGPEQHVRLTGAKAFDEAVVSSLPTGRVDVHPNDAYARKLFQEGAFDLLGSDAGLPYLLAAAPGTGRRHRTAVVAVVAAQLLAAAPVQGQADAAAGALHRVPAVAALHDRGETAAVLQQDDALAALQAVADLQAQDL